MKTKEYFEKIRAEAQAGIDALVSDEIVDRYWFLSDLGRVIAGSRMLDPKAYEARLSMGNVYTTSELAVEARVRQKAKTKVYARIKELNKLEGREPGFIAGRDNYTFILARYTDSVERTAWCRSAQAHGHERYASAETIDTVVAELEPEIRLMLGGE